jgi:glycosyltransferase involved in cell wall biosynthesis
MTSANPGTHDRHDILRVVLTSTSYPADEADWRGVFIRHMVTALATRPDVQLSVWAPPGPYPSVVHDATTKAERDMLRQLMEAGGIAHLLRNERARGLAVAIRLLRGLSRAFRATPADVYHVNWMQCILPIPRNDTPLLVTVLGNDMRLLKLPGMRLLLSRIMRRRRVAICPNADWMEAPLKALFGNVADVKAVPFGIDPRWFELSRNPSGTEDWLLVSRLTARKVGPLLRWAEAAFRDHPRRRLHVIGPMQEQVSLPDWVSYHGSASPTDLRETWFPRAAGLITLSEHDEGRPQVLLEAMASGLPIIASPLSAHTDLIDDGVEGLIVPDSDTFQAALDTLADPVTNRAMGAAGRTRIRRDMGTWDDCAGRYMGIYRSLLGNRKA